MIFKKGPGCYGINGADTVAYDAALLSQAVGRPVRVQLIAQRRDGVGELRRRAGHRSARRARSQRHDRRVGFTRSWSPTLGGRPGAGTPGNLVTGSLAGFEPAAVPAAKPGARANGFANNSNAVPSYVTGTVSGACGGTGTIAAQRVVTHNVRSTFFTGPLRSPDRLQNTFAHESFIDEIAASLRVDPVAYRLQTSERPAPDRRCQGGGEGGELGNAAVAAAGGRGARRGERSRHLLRAVRRRQRVLRDGRRGRREPGHAAWSSVTRLVIANDSGPISNPDGLRNQLEGGALQGISRTLLEEVTWDDQKVTSIDWRTYKPLYLDAEVPVIETVLINRPDMPAAGAGETAVTVVAGAIANAIFDATGAGLRQIPFTPERVKAALGSRA